MSNIFTGMLLVFLNINIDIGASRLGLLPDFVGYIFMLNGLTELTGFSDRFSRVSPHTKGMAVYAGICYALDLFGISSLMGMPLNFLLGLVSTIVSLYISYNIVIGIKDIEAVQERDLNSTQLYSVWQWLAILSLITYVLIWVPVLSIICLLAGFVVGVCYLVVFNGTKKLFYQLPEAL